MLPLAPVFSLEEITGSPWILGPLAFVIWVVALWIAKKFLIRALHRMAQRTAWTWDDVLVGAFSGPLLLAVVASGLLIFERILPLAPEWDRAFDILMAGSLALALVLFVDRACRGVLDRMAEARPILQGARGLIQGTVRGIIISLGLLVFLDSIGISITPILASLGVGSLAVGLALKDTLANLFAGLHLIVEKPLEPGHIIRLEEGGEGTVIRVGWRSTWIRTLGNHVLVVPNSRLSESILTNFNLPEPDVEVRVEVDVHYGSDLAEVEKVAVEVGRQVMKSAPGGVPAFEPSVRCTAFGDSGIRLALIARAADFNAIGPVRHALIQRLHHRFREAGIVIPYPTRTLDLPAEGTDELRAAGFSPGRGPADADGGDSANLE